jgi:hypothetical protein
MVQVYDEETGNYFKFLANNFSSTASTISKPHIDFGHQIFFQRRQTHLKIKSFVGISRNKVVIQIWTALITILRLNALRKEAKYKWHLANFISFLRISLFVKIDLQKWLDKLFLNEKELKHLNAEQLTFL